MQMTRCKLHAARCNAGFPAGFQCAAVSAALQTAGFVAVQAAVTLAGVRCQPFTVYAITA